jgi:hypothetical protein
LLSLPLPLVISDSIRSVWHRLLEAWLWQNSSDRSRKLRLPGRYSLFMSPLFLSYHLRNDDRHRFAHAQRGRPRDVGDRRYTVTLRPDLCRCLPSLCLCLCEVCKVLRISVGGADACDVMAGLPFELPVRTTRELLI